MKDKKYTKEQLHKMRHHAMLGFVTTLLLLCCSVGVLFAKYYAGHSNKGVATASGLYFTSNVLKNVSGKVVADYPVIYNTDAWDGANAYSFNLEIRNYQSQLLYNDSNLNITYEITFCLEDQTDGGTYLITYQNQTKTLESNSTSCTFLATLDGGKAVANKYTVSVKRPDGDANANYKSVGIIVTAKPVSPSYLSDYETLGGILYASLVSSQFELKGEFSKFKSGEIGQYAAFPYTVTYKPGGDNIVRNIKICWNKNKLQLDMFSPYYNLVKEDGQYKYVEIEIEPYTVFDIIFYRTNSFEDDITLETLNQMVTITDEGGSKDE